jgi:diguanylate cyclase (GGDEF)-like protein/PAS domain S-box-containing protein
MSASGSSSASRASSRSERRGTLSKVLIATRDDPETLLGKTCLWRSEVERIHLEDADLVPSEAARHSPTLVVLDVPDPEWIRTIVRQLREEPRSRPTAIVVLNRDLPAGTDAALLADGVNLVLPLPIDTFLWDRRLRELLTVPARRARRMAVRLEDWSRMLHDEQFADGVVLNIGPRGILLETDRPFDLGAKIGLSFHLPGDPEEIRIVGQVARDAGQEDGRFRHGVEFLIYHGDSRQRVAAFVESAGEEPDRPGAPTTLALTLRGLGDGGDWEEELRASELRKAMILDSALDPIITVDHEGRIVEFNAAARRVFGYSREEVFGFDVVETIVPPAVREELRRRLTAFVIDGDDQGELGQRLEAVAMRSDGSEVPVEVAVFPAYVKGRVLLTAYLRDLTDIKRMEGERVQAESALRESEARVSGITDGLPGAIYQLRLAPDGTVIFPFVSRGARDLLGVDSRALLEDPKALWSLVPPEEREPLSQAVLASGRDLVPFVRTLPVVTPEGVRRWVRAQAQPAKAPDGAVVWNGVLLDVTEQKATEDKLRQLNQDLDRRIAELARAETELQRLARYDSLTGLANRPYFLETMEDTLLRSGRRKSQAALIFVDLDGFKAVNDNLGHEAGDVLLRAAAERIRHCTRRTDAVARIGGDEFTVLVQDLKHPDDAALVAQQILTELMKPCSVKGRDLPIGASIGISVYPEDGEDGQALLRHADLAMYRAKQEGKNAYRFFLPSMSARAHERMALLSALRLGLERQEFQLQYLPVVQRPGCVSSLEALIRWRNPEIGLLPPERFIAAAEESGVILPMGVWVLRTSCQFAQSLATDVRVAVNLSARQFLQPESATLVERVLAETGLAPGRLELEVTESTVMSDGLDMVPRLERLRAIGVELTLDDFGTGCSSLSYLKKFRFRRIKLDRSFVRDLPEDPDSAALVSATLAMARDLGLEVVAEGVEREDQLAFLEARGCRTFQGHLFSPALDPREVESFLRGFRFPGD